MKSVAKKYFESLKNNNQVQSFNFSFPSFEISDDVFSSTVFDLIVEKIRNGLDENKYGNKAFEVSSYAYIEVERKLKNGVPLVGQEIFMRAYMENYLPIQLEDDKSLSALELNRMALLKSIEDRIDDTLMSIAFKEMLNVEAISELTEEIQSDKKNLTASFIILQKQFPLVYNHLTFKLREHDIFNKIEGEIKKPKKDVIGLVYEHAPEIAKANFPFHIEKLQEIKQSHFKTKELKWF